MAMNLEKIPAEVLAAMDEYVQRHKLGEDAAINEYIDRFPEWRAELEDIQFMCDVFQSAGPPKGILSESDYAEIWDKVQSRIFSKSVSLWESLQDMWEWLKRMTAIYQQQMETSPAMGEEETVPKFPADFPELVKFGYDEKVFVSVPVEETEDKTPMRVTVELMPSFEEDVEPQPCVLWLQSADKPRKLGEFKEDQLRVEVEDLPASELDKYTLVLEPITSGCDVRS